MVRPRTLSPPRQRQDRLLVATGTSMDYDDLLARVTFAHWGVRYTVSVKLRDDKRWSWAYYLEGMSIVGIGKPVDSYISAVSRAAWAAMARIEALPRGRRSADDRQPSRR